VKGNVPKDAVNKAERCESGYNKNSSSVSSQGLLKDQWSFDLCAAAGEGNVTRKYDDPTSKVQSGGSNTEMRFMLFYEM
jgi:hypothetical protein